MNIIYVGNDMSSVEVIYSLCRCHGQIQQVDENDLLVLSRRSGSTSQVYLGVLMRSSKARSSISLGTAMDSDSFVPTDILSSLHCFAETYRSSDSLSLLPGVSALLP